MILSKTAAAIFLALSCLASPALLRAQDGSRPAAHRGQFAFVYRMEPAPGGAFTLTVDYAELLSGDAASRAARDASDPSPKDLSGLYIENRTRVLRTLTVPAWAQVYLLQEMQPTLVRASVLYSLLQGERSAFGAFYGFPYRCEGEEAYCLPVRIIRRGGQVVRIEQEYLP